RPVRRSAFGARWCVMRAAAGRALEDPPRTAAVEEIGSAGAVELLAPIPQQLGPLRLGEQAGLVQRRALAVISRVAEISGLVAPPRRGAPAAASELLHQLLAVAKPQLAALLVAVEGGRQVRGRAEPQLHLGDAVQLTAAGAIPRHRSQADGAQAESPALCFIC